MITGARVDGRADLYALGCVAFRMVTGRRVFDNVGSAGILFDHIERVPHWPSEVVADVFIPPALEDIIMCCLEKKPENRPASALELHDMLEDGGFARGWTPARASEWWNQYEHSPLSPSLFFG
jgi:serine/threonine-protein kinase